MNNLPAEKPITDLSEADMDKLRNFKAEGLPGLARLAETDFHRMTEMYMNGSTYWQIANALGFTRPLVMYVSHTYGWYPAKQEYLTELQEKIKGRVIDSKLASQDFLLLMVQAYQKKIGKKLQKYLATDDPTHAEEINLKEIDKLLKSVQMLQELSGPGKQPGKPAVGLNVGDGVTIERSGENKLTITPNPIDKTLGSMLKKFADSRRVEQNESDSSDESDIDDETKNEEPNNE